ncbi:MAG: hypothetical protein JRH10_01365 [Deltaproteobacteria bacterium]|nr:hypothetical protein [Deltaproteobacteria bacterium]MBW2446163.1 hypothetical protein [Deltaproteobacteria bacterium]
MKTIATMALLMGTLAVGIAPAAEAREDRASKHETRNEWNGGKRFAPHTVQLHARQVKEIRSLAVTLERATDELRRDARHAVGRVNRYEARALRAIYRLEAAADDFSRRAKRRGPKAVRELRHELRTVEAAFRNARDQARALHGSPELRKDFRRVNRVLAALDESFEPRRHVAWNQRGSRGWDGRGFRTAQR